MNLVSSDKTAQWLGKAGLGFRADKGPQLLGEVEYTEAQETADTCLAVM